MMMMNLQTNQWQVLAFSWPVAALAAAQETWRADDFCYDPSVPPLWLAGSWNKTWNADSIWIAYWTSIGGEPFLLSAGETLIVAATWRGEVKFVGPLEEEIACDALSAIFSPIPAVLLVALSAILTALAIFSLATSLEL